MRLFAAKVAPPSLVIDIAAESESDGSVQAAQDEASSPNAPGTWRLTDENGAESTVRVTDQNGELYAIMGNVAVPVNSIAGDWTLVD
jgi:hypothetical protein